MPPVLHQCFRDDSESSLSFAPRLLLVTSRKNNRGLHRTSQAGRRGFAWGEPGQIFLNYLLGGLDSTWALRSNSTWSWLWFDFSSGFQILFVCTIWKVLWSNVSVSAFPFSTRGPSHTRSERTGTQRIRHTFGWYSKWGVYDSSQLQDFNPTLICLALSPRTIYIVRICTFSMLPNPSQSTQPKSWYLTGYFVFLVETPRKGSPS
jgi:hypothetical protein